MALKGEAAAKSTAAPWAYRALSSAPTGSRSSTQNLRKKYEPTTERMHIEHPVVSLRGSRVIT